MFKRSRCCECYKVQNSSLSQQVLSQIVGAVTFLLSYLKLGFVFKLKNFVLLYNLRENLKYLVTLERLDTPITGT